MKMQQLKETYLLGGMSKAEYIKKMHRFHRLLFEYSDLLKKTDISRVEITDEGVVAQIRSSKINLVCDLSDERIIPFEILNFSEHEKDDMVLALMLIKDGMVVFDIGANIGWYSLTISAMKKKLEIHAFEPVKRTYEQLRKNIKLNKDKVVNAHNFGFGNSKKTHTMYFDPKLSGNASLAKHTQSKSVEKVQVKIKRLDDFTSEGDNPVDYIKCDVEGAELLVLTGGVKTLERQKPIVYLELLRKWSKKFGYHPNDVIAFMASLGYQCFTEREKKLKRFRKMDDKTIEKSFFFLHAIKHKSHIKRLEK